MGWRSRTGAKTAARDEAAADTVGVLVVRWREAFSAAVDIPV